MQAKAFVTHGPHQSALPSNAGATIRLRDGRQLGYAEWGDRAGWPVFYFHGMPGSRLERCPDLSLLDRLGIRLVTVDRPGYGLSTFLPGRRFLDWPADVAQLADALGVQRFTAVGVSGGGPHAAACAYLLPDRLRDVVIVSSPCPVSSWGSTAGMGLLQRLALVLARLSPVLLRPLIWLVSNPARDPMAFTMAGYDRLAPADRRVLARPEVRAMFVEDFRESARQGVRGYAHDISLLARPWGFRPEDIAVPASLWHGVDDTIVPVTMGGRLAEAIPRCRAHFLPDAGHFLALDHLEDILQAEDLA